MITQKEIDQYDFDIVVRINLWEIARLIRCDLEGNPILFNNFSKGFLPTYNTVIIPTYPMMGHNLKYFYDTAIKKGQDFCDNNFIIVLILKENGDEIGVSPLDASNYTYKTVDELKNYPWKPQWQLQNLLK